MMYCLVTKNAITKKEIVLAVLFFICASINLMMFPSVNFFEGTYLFLKHVFSVIVVFYFLKMHKQNNATLLFSAVEGFAYFNLLLILTGYIFSIDLFATYDMYRFGYNGVFKSTSTASYFYMCFLAYYYVKHINKKDNIPLLITILASSIMVGSKTLFISSALFIFLYTFDKRQLMSKRPIKKQDLFLVSIALLIIGFVSAFLYINNNTLLSSVYNDDGLISAFFSYRNTVFSDAVIQIKEQFSAIQYLFGNLASQIRRPELALADLFINLGVIGTITFLSLLFVNIPKKLPKRVIFLCSYILLITLLRGNFFYYPTVLFFSAIFINAIIRSND